jgi:hypothetical protein
MKNERKEQMKEIKWNNVDLIEKESDNKEYFIN